MTEKRTPYALLERKPAELRVVARAAHRYEEARVALHDALAAAFLEHGRSLREIADASGIYSHEQVRRIVARLKSAAEEGGQQHA